MGKLGSEWHHVTIPVFLFSKAGDCLDINQPGMNLVTQFESGESWKEWIEKEILQNLTEDTFPSVFIKTLPLKSGCQKHCIQLFVQKGVIDSYVRIQMVPMVEKISTKKSKKIDWLQFIDSMRDLIYVIDHKRRFLFVNKAFLEFLNKKSSEVIGNPIFSVFPQAKGTLIEEKQREVMDSGEPTLFQYFFPIPPYENWFDIQMIPMHQFVFVRIKTNAEEPMESRSRKSFFDDILKVWHFLPDPTILFDQSYNQLEANPAFYETFLFPSNVRIEPQTLWSQFFPEEHKILQTAINRAFQESKISTFQWKTPISRLIKKTFSVNVFPVLDETSTPMFAMIQCHDLTDKVQQIQTAKEQVDSYSRIMNSLQFMILVVSDDWKIQYANQTAIHFFGLVDLDFQQYHLLDVMPEIKEMELSEKIRTVLSEKKSIILEGIPLRDRQFYIALFSITSGVVCLFRDVTERSNLKQQQSLTEKYEHYLIEHSPDAVYIQNKTGEIEFANQSYRKKEASTQLSDLISSDQKVWDGNTVWNDISHRSGEESLCLQLMQFPYRNDEGTIDGICGVIRDITETMMKDQAPAEYAVPWKNLIQTIRSLVSHHLSFRDWIKFFLIQLADYAQATYLWVCIKTDTQHWLMMDWKSDGSFQQVLMNETEAQEFCKEKHCSCLDQENSYLLSKEKSWSKISLLIERESQVIGWMSLARKEAINLTFVAILMEITHLIGDYQEHCANSERERNHYSQYATIFQQLPVGLAVFDPAGNFEICNPHFQHFFPQQVDFKEVNLWELQFLNAEQLSLIKMGLMVQTRTDIFMNRINQRFDLKTNEEELLQLYVLSIQENEYKNFSDHYLLIIQPLFSTSTEQKKFLDYWEQTSNDLQHQLQVIREVLSVLTKTSVNRNEAEMAKQMNRSLLKFMRTFRIFIDSTRQKINS